MKRLFLAVVLLTLVAGEGRPEPGADTVSAVPAVGSTGVTVYTFFFNVVHEPFPFPLVGFFNMAFGNHEPLQIGFVNYNSGSFDGLQTGFVNIVVAGFQGMQTGFVNTAGAGFRGVQLGFVNTAAAGGSGAQVGFVNTSAAPLTGTQIGFVNIVDSIDGGIPVGFISVVRHGGFRAVEYALQEFHLLGVGFKLGVERFYTTFSVAYDPSGSNSGNDFVAGIGFGSIIPVGAAFFFNPEFAQLTRLGFGRGPQFTSFTPFFGYSIDRHFSVTAGPSVTWQWATGETDLQEPVFAVVHHRINDRHSLALGARLALRARF